MKKAILVTVLASTVSSAAAADYVGFFVGGTMGGFGGGLHYQQDVGSASAMRYALTGLGLSNGYFNIGGEFAYLNDLSAANGFGPLQPYYGLGLGAGVTLGNASAVGLYTHVLGGLRYNVASTPLSVFGEVNLGPSIVFASAGSSSGVGVSFGLGGRLGINYRL